MDRRSDRMAQGKSKEKGKLAMILFNEKRSEIIAAAARQMSDSDKTWHLETIAGNLALQLKALAALCHQVGPHEGLDAKEVQGIGYMLEELARDAEACGTIICPGLEDKVKSVK
jgi:hypothetical protein